MKVPGWFLVRVLFLSCYVRTWQRQRDLWCFFLLLQRLWPTGLHLYYLYSLPKAPSPNTLTLELGVLTFRALTFEFSQKGHRQLITGGYFWITEF